MNFKKEIAKAKLLGDTLSYLENQVKWYLEYTDSEEEANAYSEAITELAEKLVKK